MQTPIKESAILFMYRCTHMSKEVQRDNYQTGCTGPVTCVMDSRVNITANTMQGLVHKLESELGLSIDSLWVGDVESGVVGFNRIENDNGDEPTESQLTLWKAGKRHLWLADYHFAIEKHTVPEPVTADDFVGVTTHE